MSSRVQKAQTPHRPRGLALSPANNCFSSYTHGLLGPRAQRAGLGWMQ